MSNRAINWCLTQRAGSSGAKALLMVLANMVRDEPTQGWPELHAWGTSLAALAEATEQDRKSVVANLQRLESAGLIVPAGRAGKTMQITVYRIPVPADFARPTGDAPTTEKSPENGKLSENGTVPLLNANSTVFPAKASRFSLESVPKTGHETLLNPIEPKENPGEPLARRSRRAAEPPCVGFNEFWAAYPRKDGKAVAQKAFAKLKPHAGDGRLLRTMLAAVERQRQSDQWRKDGGKFIPHATTWLNGCRWEDSGGSVSPATDEAHPAWALAAGFATRWEAENAQCFATNSHLFAGGRRKELA